MSRFGILFLGLFVLGSERAEAMRSGEPQGDPSATAPSLPLSPTASAEHTPAPEVRRGRRLIAPVKADPSKTVAVDEVAILNESHSLFELLDENPSENLVHQHPSIAMNASQRVASWINFSPVRRIQDPDFSTATINLYPVFSDGIPEASGKRINGQYAAIQAFVDHVKAAARGDGSSSKMLLFVGPAGTGKTYFLNILSEVAQNLTATRPEYFTYSYEWKNLKEIPSLASVINVERLDSGEIYEHPFRCPINESPLNLIPQEFASTLIEAVTPQVKRMAGAKPTPVRYHCPHCQHIQSEILKNYLADHAEEMIKAGTPGLSPEKVVEILDHHIRIKRVVIGSNGTIAKLDAEPKDVDFQGLMTAPNALVFHTFGQGHPMSYYLSGKILQANGSLLMFDEFFRDDKGLRDQALNIIETHEVSRGGAPSVKLDMLVIGASNNESVRDAQSNETSKAHVDRTRMVRMPYLLNPLDEAQNLLMMKNEKTIRMQKITGTVSSEEDSSARTPEPVVPADLRVLFPIPEGTGERQGPDHRYNIWFDGGPRDEPTHLSPHALMYMAMVVSGSRLVTDTKKATEFGARQVITDIAFRDVYTRLLVLMGKHTVNASALRDLKALSHDLKEGDGGISERDAANIWLTQSIIEAQKEENGNCLTASIAQRVLLDLFRQGAINYDGDLKQRQRWENIADMLYQKFLVLELENDLSAALSSGMGSVTSMYDEIFEEMVQLSINSDAREYRSKTGETHPINKERLAEIEKLYLELNKTPLSIHEILIIHAANGGEIEKRRHAGLLNAVTRYLAKTETSLVTYDSLFRFASTREGSAEVRDKHHELGRVMTQDLGYCPHCLKSALQTIRQAKSRRAQVR